MAAWLIALLLLQACSCSVGWAAAAPAAPALHLLGSTQLVQLPPGGGAPTASCSTDQVAHAQLDGLLLPAAASFTLAASVALELAGGSGVLLTITDGGLDVTLVWPPAAASADVRLRTPDGSAATYRSSSIAANCTITLTVRDGRSLRLCIDAACPAPQNVRAIGLQQLPVQRLSSCTLC